MMQDIFPNEEVLMNYSHPLLKYDQSNRSIELDIYVLRLNLAIEVQGKQHYSTDKSSMMGQYLKPQQVFFIYPI